jgi:Fe-S-cluster-containing hydrogenase component 2
MNAISVVDKKATINLDECVECSTCVKAGVCPTESVEMEPELAPGRALRRNFSDPWVSHPTTNVPGRGTEEMKTNEVTGRFKRGFCGIAAELGRPGTGTRFYDVQKVAMACAECGIEFEPLNPVTALMTDPAKGIIKAEVLNEKVLSAIVEFICPNEKVPTVLKRIKEVAATLDTVFSLDICCRSDADETFPMDKLIREAGLTASLNGKTNLGLGRPRAAE